MDINNVLATNNITYTPPARRNSQGVWKLHGSQVEEMVIRGILNGLNLDKTVDEIINVIKNPPIKKRESSLESSSLQSFDITPKDFRHSEGHWSAMDEIFSGEWYWTMSKGDKQAQVFLHTQGDEFIHVMDADKGSVITAALHQVNQYDNLNRIFTETLKKIEKGIPTIYNTPSEKSTDVRVATFVVNNYSAIMINTRWGIKALYTTNDNGDMTVHDCLIHPYSLKEKFRLPTLSEYISTMLSYLPTRINKRLKEMPIPYSSVKGIPTFKYVNLEEYCKPGPCPTWMFYEKRYTEDERKVLRAFTWSILDSRDTGRQALYMYDNGVTGKSAYQSALASVLGRDLIGVVQKDALANQFGLSKLWDKRLICIPDNKNKAIIRSEKMHMILGGDYADIEYKNEKSFIAKFNAKVLIAGNVLPNIDPYATHERTRLIILKPKMNDEILQQIAVVDAAGNVVLDDYGNPQYIGDSTFSKRLIEEFSHYLCLCEEAYNELCPNRNIIILPKSVNDELYLMDSGVESAMLDEYMVKELEFDKKNKMTKAALYSHYRENATIYHLETSNQAYSNFVDSLLKQGKIEQKKITEANGKRRDYFVGVKLKDHAVTTYSLQGFKGIGLL